MFDLHRLEIRQFEIDRLDRALGDKRVHKLKKLKKRCCIRVACSRLSSP
jgi:hypothetical protein